MKKHRKTLTQKQLKKKYERRISKILFRRDKYRCQIQNYRHTCSKTLCCDHRPVKRGMGNICFFDNRNLTTVCTTANFLAERDHYIAEAIARVARDREGQIVYDFLGTHAKQHCGYQWTEEDVLKEIDRYEKLWPEDIIGGQDRWR